jgi:hypothetical protein
VLLAVSNLLRILNFANANNLIQTMGAGAWLYPDISPHF